MSNKKEEFHALIEQLIPLGEDEKELRYWEAIFDDLTESEQADVLQNLKEELESLRSQQQ